MMFPMPTTFDKLNLRDQRELVVLNAPSSFEAELAGLKGKAIQRTFRVVKQLDYLLVFVTRKAEVDALASEINKRANGDAIVWFAYPKGTSKRYKCDFNRDSGWDSLNKLGWETVRAVAIDEDWSALRMRRAEFVKARK
jgi:hypothetical protein